MEELYKLKEMLCKELEEYGSKGELSAGSLSTIDTLAHALKNIDKIIMYKDDDGYSGRGYPMGGSYRYPRYDGGSFRGGSYARGMKRDGMGRYSRDDGMIDELRELMHDVPEDIKHDIQRIIDKMEK